MHNAILNKLSVIIHHLMQTRGVGHTYAALNGVKGSEQAILIVQDYAFARYLESENGLKGRVKTLSRIQDTLRGSAVPIIFDHFALGTLLGESTGEIMKLQKENAQLKEKLNAQGV